MLLSKGIHFWPNQLLDQTTSPMEFFHIFGELPSIQQLLLEQQLPVYLYKCSESKLACKLNVSNSKDSYLFELNHHFL